MTAPAAVVQTSRDRDARRSRRAAHARQAEGLPPATRQERTRPRRLRFTPRTVRARIVCLLALPVISLTSLWGIAAVDTVSSAYDQSQLHSLDATVAMPLDDAVAAVQAERTAATAYLAVPEGDPSAFSARITATRAALGALQTGIGESAAAAGDLNPVLTVRLQATARAIAGLSALRTEVLGRSTGIADAQQAYSAAVADAFAVQSTLAGTSGAPGTAEAAVALSEAGEQLSVQDTVLAGAHAAGTFSPSAYQRFTGAVYAERAYLQQASATLPDPTSSRSGAQLTALQNAVLATGPGAAAASASPAQVWGAAAPSVLDAISAAQRAASVPASDNPYRRLLTTGSGLGVLLGLFALVVSLLISVGIGRRLVTDLVGLRDYALDLAGRRLPETMAKLRAGQEVEPGEQAPPLDPDAGELGQVADALAVASRAAMQAAVERAELVSGVSGVFLNLARRSQVLVHRQLALLDAMERRIEEPDHLEDLFRLDHLATRMRRHAEGLIILSGATPGRAWRNPVDLTDVVRAAAAEAEDYPRVEVRRMPRARVLGPVVADLTHLLAELIENAASFSPPHTRVVVGGEPVGSGFAIEIEDRGLGMSPDALREANRRIGESSGDDLFDGDRLGLFVVSRLARRHEIRVSLCASAYGGITAVVLIPSKAMQQPGAPDEPPVPEHDLGVSGALSHGPLAGPGRIAVSQGAAAGVELAADGAGPARLPRIAVEPAVASVRQPALEPDAAHALDAQSVQPSGGPHANGRAVDAVQPTTFAELLGRPREPQDPDGNGGAPHARRGPEGLPQRVRQASLAPQLRRDPAAGPQAAEQAVAQEPRPQRTPEQTRATMSAFQRGFTLGRTDEPAVPPSRDPQATAEGGGTRTAGRPEDHHDRGEGTR